jgi:hypothetical protein
MTLKTPFGTDWDALDLASLASFLAAPVHEGLTWEAKGGRVRPEHIREAVCAFANSDLGGYLIIGASKDAQTQTWRVDGFEFPNEPELWITDCLDRGGVDPLPSFNVKPWPVSPSASVAVVQVYPVAITPCLTSSGEVWQRLSGKSQRVTDAASLRRLFERGERSRERAMATAEAGRDDLAREGAEGRQSKVVVSVASPSLPPDVSAAVFRETTYTTIRSLVAGRLGRQSGAITQHAITFSTDSFGLIEHCTVRVGRHGSVAVASTDPDIVSGLEDIAFGGYRPDALWKAAMEIVRHLGGYGPVALAMHLSDPERGATSIARWTEVRPPTAEELDSIRREALRAYGRPAWEP